MAWPGRENTRDQEWSEICPERREESRRPGESSEYSQTHEDLPLVLAHLLQTKQLAYPLLTTMHRA